MTTKTRAIPSLHRDNFLAKVPARQLAGARMLRRVTQPPHIAGPLVLICGANETSYKTIIKAIIFVKKDLL
jgi:hypothetical protein